MSHAEENRNEQQVEVPNEFQNEDEEFALQEEDRLAEEEQERHVWAMTEHFHEEFVQPWSRSWYYKLLEEGIKCYLSTHECCGDCGGCEVEIWIEDEPEGLRPEGLQLSGTYVCCTHADLCEFDKVFNRLLLFKRISRQSGLVAMSA